MNAAPRFKKKEEKGRQGAAIIFIKPFWLVNTQITRKSVWLSIYILKFQQFPRHSFEPSWC
jgi:hypothetical protein